MYQKDQRALRGVFRSIAWALARPMNLVNDGAAVAIRISTKVPQVIN